MNSKHYTFSTYIHFTLINLVSFGWICATPIMVQHMNDLFGGNAYFFQLVLMSTIAGLLTSVIFGQIVDRTSSRFVLFIGMLLNLCFWIILATSTNPYLIGAAFIMEGVSFSALMIARAPYFHEVISQLKSESAYGELEANSKMGMLVAMFFCMIGVGYLYEVDESIPFVANAAIVVLTMLLMINYSGVNLSPVKAKRNIGCGILKDLRQIYGNHNSLFWLTTSEGVFSALTPYLFVIVNVHLLSSGASIIFISYLIAFVYLFRMAGAYFVRGEVSSFSIVLLLALFSILMFFMSVSVSAWVVGLIFLVNSIFREYIEVYLATHNTWRSPVHLRGSIRSYSEVVSNLGVIVIMLVMAVYVDAVPSGVWVSGYAALFGLTLLTFVISLRNRNKTLLVGHQ